METIFYILLAIGGTWWFVYERYYSPKAMVKTLWNEIFELTNVIKKIKDGSKDSFLADTANAPFEKQIERRKIVIKALLGYYFDPEEDEEYIEDNRP